jgi:hypothetical protein
MTFRFNYDPDSVVEDETDAVYLVHKILTEALCNYRPHAMLLKKHKIGVGHPLVRPDGKVLIKVIADDQGFDLTLEHTNKEARSGSEEATKST